ncbi:hypothetical protein OCU04_001625 [Sclerotinia nivalis]|uniref:Uncharacterized protein n=1 Tax=Sclerotinia nivalis TaxID=352851 RepID=A0A9X0AZ69_9HELO|nr:hypothetical protein OCU04_001625 [Sclerotinia nivalis]
MYGTYSSILAAEALLREVEAENIGSPERDGKKKVSGEAFFISDDVSLPYFDFVRKIYTYAGHPVPQNEGYVLWICARVYSFYGMDVLGVYFWYKDAGGQFSWHQVFGWWN